MATEKTLRRITIKDGPSKFDLMVSQYDGCGTNRRSVKFCLDETERLMDEKHNVVEGWVEVIIDAVGRECGSDEQWFFRGFVLGTHPGCGHVHGYFCTGDRIGWIEFKK